MIHTNRTEPPQTQPSMLASVESTSGAALVALVAGVSGQLLCTNEAFDAFFGRRQGDTREVAELIRFLDGADIGSLIKDVLTTGNPACVSARAVRITDVEQGYFGVVWMDIACEPMLLEDGMTPAVWIKAAQSSSEPGSGAKTSAEPTQASECSVPEDLLPIDKDRVGLALEVGQVGVWEWDLASRLVWNSQMYRLIGVPGGSEPPAEGFMNLVHPTDRLVLDAKVARCLATQTDFADDFRITRVDTGQQRWIAGRGRVLCNAAGESVAMMGVNFDITDEVSNQEKLGAVAQRRAEFLAVLGHELRNPLAPLAYIARKMETAADAGAEQCSAAEVIKRQVAQLTRLVEDLLEVSRIELGKIDLRMQVLRVTQVIEAAVEAVMPSVQERQQHLEWSSLPDAWVSGDRARLIQVICNLLANASKYTQVGGRIYVEVAQDEETVCMTVRDNGPGIQADLASILFDPFTQGRATLDRARDGLGIGLSIVKRLVELHGGTITFTTSSSGTSFTVSLPRPALLPAQKPTDLAATEELPALRILVVEDNLDAATLLADLLRDAGHEVRLATNGQEGLDQARADPPDVILMDVGLPKIDGWTVAQALRADARYNNVVMIAMSGYGQSGDRDRSAKAGFNLHLTKPTDITDVFNFLKATRLTSGART